MKATGRWRSRPAACATSTSVIARTRPPAAAPPGGTGGAHVITPRWPSDTWAVAQSRDARLGRCTQERWNRDPAKRARRPLHHHPSRGDTHGLRPSAPCFVGCRVRRTRCAPLRVGAAVGPAASSGDRAGSGMDAGRDQDVSVPRGRWPCHGRGKAIEWSRSARRICCRPGRGGCACRRTRAWCRGLRDQGCTCGGPRIRG